MKKILLIVPILSIILTACGGGGGGGTVGGSTLTSSNASQASSAAIQAARLVSPTAALGEVKIASISIEKKPPLISILEKVISISKSYMPTGELHIQGTLPQTTIHCTDGGTINVNATWTGPDNPTSYSQVINLNGIMEFNLCKEGTETFNGAITAVVQGPLDTPTKLTISAPNFTYVDTSADNNLTMTNLTLVFSNITYSDTELAGGTIQLKGDISGIVDGNPASFACDNLTLTFNSGLIGVTVSISGKLKASCLSDWVTITTDTPIFFPSFVHTYCPTAGQINITSGGNTVRAVVASDSAISVYFNNSLVKTYKNCTDIELRCENIL